MAGNLKTRSNGNRFVTYFVLVGLLIPSFACSNIYFDPNDLKPVEVRIGGNNPAPQNTPGELPTGPTGGGLSTPLPTMPIPLPTTTRINPTPGIIPTQSGTTAPPYLYNAQAGDSLVAVAFRFGVDPSEITSPEKIPSEGLINPGQLLMIPKRLGSTLPNTPLIPDSEIIHSPSAINFDTDKFVLAAGGHLAGFKEYLAAGWHTGAQVIRKVALDMSVNPRILLGLLEYQSHWVYGKPTNLAEWDYPMGNVEFDRKDLYLQCMWASQALFKGYYGWREGRLKEIKFADGKIARLAPELNAGSVALIYFFAQMNSLEKVNSILYSSDGFPARYSKMFGDPWQRAQAVEPLFPNNFTQPTLELPYLPGKPWSYTGGPHPAWGEGPLAAIDFAPPSAAPGCNPTHLFVTASAPGLVVRSGNGVVVLDLDGDGNEQTGWNLLYLHIATQNRVEVGKWIDVNQNIGHPSCEGGFSTGTHVHFARKYNGEWIPADGPLPFVLSGWRVHNGEKPYLGTMVKDNQVATASTSSSVETLVTRPPITR